MTPFVNVATSARNGSFISDPKLDEYHDMIWAQYADWDLRTTTYRELSVYILENAWYIPTPANMYYMFWQPWIQNYHGEISMGNTIWNWPKWVWVDQDLKQQALR